MSYSLNTRCSDFFPKCTQWGLDISAFVPAAPESLFPFPVVGVVSQVKLIRHSMGQWFLLGFRSDPPDDPNGADYVDGYEARFSPYFMISYRLTSVHISLKPDDTGFASTGTHYVEPSGRLLVSSHYRWSEDKGPHGTSFVSRVDEYPSS